MRKINSPEVQAALRVLHATATAGQAEAIHLIDCAIAHHDAATVQQADAWLTVAATLDRVAPGWLDKPVAGRLSRGVDAAVGAIETLARQRDAAIEIATASLLDDALPQQAFGLPVVLSALLPKGVCIVVEAGR